MRKIVLLMHASLDGYVAGPNGELEWARVDEEIYREVAASWATVDTALYGRVTYGMMEGYWPTVPTNPESTRQELEHARWVEEVQKVVVSTSLENVAWNHTRLARNIEDIRVLKGQPGGDMMIFGSPSLAHSLMEAGLIDEYRLNINPVVLGSGVPLFKTNGRTNLKLLTSKTYSSGVVGLHYRTDGKL